jgi:hypothetical protein
LVIGRECVTENLVNLSASDLLSEARELQDLLEV